MKRLPAAIQCPSSEVKVEKVGYVFIHEDCSGSKCGWWSNGCDARRITEQDFMRFEEALAPECPLASKCRWHVEAVAEGKKGCPVRRLGMLCGHQGGDWNTFEMMSPEEWEEALNG